MLGQQPYDQGLRSPVGSRDDLGRMALAVNHARLRIVTHPAGQLSGFPSQMGSESEVVHHPEIAGSLDSPYA
jgi:hypothetical protein